MALTDLDDLRQIAFDTSKAHIDALSTGPVCLTALADDPPEWLPILRRTVYQADFAVWAEIAEIEMDIDDAGQVDRFVDHGRRNRALAATESISISDNTVKQIAMTTGSVSAFARIVGRHQTGPLHVISFEQFVPDFPNRLILEIDPKARVVVSLEVTERFVP
jgi:hypothetical protein